jgi:hypothetical protein
MDSPDHDDLDIEDIGDALRDDRPLRAARGYRIRFALDSVAFAPLILTDPVPLGRQVLEVAGAIPIEAHSLFFLEPNGDFEDIRLDETIDLRERGAERFIAFSSDRLFRLILDRHQIVWGPPGISETVLRTLAGIGEDMAVYLEVRGGADRLIAEGETVDLTEPGVEAFITAPRPRRYVFFVNGTRYETDQEVLTGLQIKARVADWDPSHDLVLEGHDNDPDQIIADDQVVHLDTEHGHRRFSSAPKANFG